MTDASFNVTVDTEPPAEWRAIMATGPGDPVVHTGRQSVLDTPTGTVCHVTEERTQDSVSLSDIDSHDPFACNTEDVDPLSDVPLSCSDVHSTHVEIGVKDAFGRDNETLDDKTENGMREINSDIDSLFHDEGIVDNKTHNDSTVEPGEVDGLFTDADNIGLKTNIEIQESYYYSGAENDSSSFSDIIDPPNESRRCTLSNGATDLSKGSAHTLSTAKTRGPALPSGPSNASDNGVARNRLSNDASNGRVVYTGGNTFSNTSDDLERTFQLKTTNQSVSVKVEPTAARINTSSSADINNNAAPCESLELMAWDSDDTDHCGQMDEAGRTTVRYDAHKIDLAAAVTALTGPDNIDITSLLIADDIKSEAPVGRVDMSDNIDTTVKARKINCLSDMNHPAASSTSGSKTMDNKCEWSDMMSVTYTEQNRIVPGTDWTEVFSVSCTGESVDEVEWRTVMSRDEVECRNVMSRDEVEWRTVMSRDEDNEEPVTDETDPGERHLSELSGETTSGGTQKGERSSGQNNPVETSLFQCAGLTKENVFRCYECERSFTKQCYLTRHHRASHGGMGHLECKLCNFSAKVESKFRRHCLDDHDDAKPFKCNFNDCKFAAALFYRLVNHKKIHSDEKECVCGYPECMFSCHKRHALQVHQHLHTERNQLAQVSCNDNQTQQQYQDGTDRNNTSTQKDLTSAGVSHIHPTVTDPLLFGSSSFYKCTKCEKICLTKSGLSNHVNKIHFGLKHLKCGLCSHSSKTEHALRKHCQEHHGNTRPFACDFPGCGYQAGRYCALTTHKQLHSIKARRQAEFLSWADGGNRQQVSSVNPKRSFETVFKCQQCHFQYLRPEDLSRHVQRVHFDSSHLRCMLCDTTTKTEKRLTQHCIDVHDVHHPFQCDYTDCSYSTDKYFRLQNHKNLIHTNRRDYICEQCGKTFSTNKNLFYHKQACFHLKEYLCDKCGKTFDRLRCLKTHINAVHFGERPHVCKHCGKHFDQKTNMKRHLLIHDKVFPFICYICERKFRHSNTLKGHMKRHGAGDGDQGRHQESLIMKNPEGREAAEKVRSCKHITQEDGSFLRRTVSKTGPLKLIIRTIKEEDSKKNLNQILHSTGTKSRKNAPKNNKRYRVMSGKLEWSFSDTSYSQSATDDKGERKILRRGAQSTKVKMIQNLAAFHHSPDDVRSKANNSKKKRSKHAQSTEAQRVKKVFKQFEHSTKVERTKMKQTQSATEKLGLIQIDETTKDRRIGKVLKQKPESKRKKLKMMMNEDISNQGNTVTKTLRHTTHHDNLESEKKRKRRLPLSYTCAKCQIEFKERRLLVVHLQKIHSDIYNLTCKLCQFTSETMVSLRKHYTEDHERVKAFVCDFQRCTYSTNTIQRLLKHQRWHPSKGHPDATPDESSNPQDSSTGLLKGSCDTQGGQDSSTGLLKGSCDTQGGQSLSQQCARRVRYRPCKYCGIIFMNMRMLEKHYAEVHVSCRPFQCTVQGCGYNATRMSLLQVHRKGHTEQEHHQRQIGQTPERSLHGGLGKIGKKTFPTYSYECRHCEARFMRQEDLSRHTQNIHLDSSHLRCRFCSISLQSANQLQQHCDEVHDCRYPFQCNNPDCTYVSRRRHELKKHQFRMHSEKKEFVCEICGIAFKSVSDLGNHTRSCLGLKEFLCDVCGQTFNHPQSLQIHQRTVHDGLKPFTCSQCEKCFGDRSNLRRHMRIHKDLFPYSCNICQRTFRHSNSLKSHMNGHGDVLL